MTRHQGLVLAVAAGNIALMMLFPPYDTLGLFRGGQSFDAFYFVMEAHPGKVLNSGMLLLELYWLLINAALAWWLLRPGRPKRNVRRQTAVLIFAAANLVFIFLFPPLENYASTLRASGTYFDGFYFVFGDKWQRRFYVPLLYMEVLWVLVNSALMWLLMREPARARDADEAEPAA